MIPHIGNTTCGYCGGKLRALFSDGKGKNTKRQRNKWRVCPRGHQTMRKQG